MHQHAVVAAAAAIAAAALYVRSRAARSYKRVAVASTSTLKVDAARRALGGDTVGFKAASLVADQPLGLEVTMRGCYNRLAALIGEGGAATAFDMAVAIENGLLKTSLQQGAEVEEVWVDVAVVMVHDLRTSKTGIATSTGLRFPTAAVGDWAEAGAEGTVGEVLAEELGCDKQDPHAALTKGRYPRAALLEQAIRAAVASL